MAGRGGLTRLAVSAGSAGDRILDGVDGYRQKADGRVEYRDDGDETHDRNQDDADHQGSAGDTHPGVGVPTLLIQFKI